MNTSFKTRRIKGLLPGFGVSSMLVMLIAIMVFLTALALAGAVSLSLGAQNMQRQLSRGLTVQIIHGEPQVKAVETAAAAKALRRLKGVESVEVLRRETIAYVLEPWLGAMAHDADLPVPAIIEVQVAGEALGQVASIKAALAKIAPHARVESQAQWLKPLTGLFQTILSLAIFIVFLTALALIGTVVMATRAALNTHRETIEVMHLMGAEDGQISRMFEWRVALDAVLGGVIAIVVAAGVLMFVVRGATALDSAVFNAGDMSGPIGLVFIILPLLAAVIAALTARIAVFRSLRETL